MPLSEEEQRLLDEMERNLYQREADTVSVSAPGRAVNVTRVTIGLLIALAGLGLVIAGAATKLIVLGVAGFAVAVAGLWYASVAPRVAHDSADDSVPPHERLDDDRTRAATRERRRGQGSFMDRMSEEWDRRDER